MEVRQRAYHRRASASEHDELEESRSRHEQLRSSMFSTSARSSSATQPNRRGIGGSGVGGGGGLGGGGGSVDSSTEETTAARIDAAIKAALAIDSTRGADTFGHHRFTPHSSTKSTSTGSAEFTPALAPSSHPPHPYLQPQPYRPHHPSPGGTMGGGGAVNTFGAGEYVGHRGGVPMPLEDSTGSPTTTGQSRSVDNRSGSSIGSGTGGVVGVAQAPGRATRERRGGAHTATAVWQPEPPAPVAVVPVSGGMGDHFSPGGGGKGGAGRQQQLQQQQQQQQNLRDHGHQSTDSYDRNRPPPEYSIDVSAAEAADEEGSSAVGAGSAGGNRGGGGEDPLPGDYEPPLQLPDGCHHIPLEKFLEVMTGPGLRVRKHHRAGKGSSGLRVLRYSEAEDSLTWDSHKILGAAQHVLPMGDVQSVSSQPGNRVVLMCVGGKDSYAVFEAANEDAAAVLFVGLERLRERTQRRRVSA